MSHHVKVKPIRVHSYNAELDCHVSRVVAYRAVCSCGWRSKSSRERTGVALVGIAHRKTGSG